MGLVFIIGILCIFALIGGFCWPYAINTWLEFFGREGVLLFWHGVLLGFCPIVGKLAVVAAIITWIAMLILL